MLFSSVCLIADPTLTSQKPVLTILHERMAYAQVSAALRRPRRASWS